MRHVVYIRDVVTASVQDGSGNGEKGLVLQRRNGHSPGRLNGNHAHAFVA